MWKAGPNPPGGGQARLHTSSAMGRGALASPHVTLGATAGLFTQEPNQFHLAGKEGRGSPPLQPHPLPARVE